jgi:hypothetical protein
MGGAMVDTEGRLKAIREFRSELRKLDSALLQYELTVRRAWKMDQSLILRARGRNPHEVLLLKVFGV